ncbi:beta-ketoacyl-ACP synthase 3 [Streptomyces sp. MBT65]|uniref:beta-ketoacyl-ACP synthase 3 n=1 Tax=Streptomyces sp. MBT65 TaxID=1488395 RepID=UPI00190C658C|nr:beta-ketoacyl-ACP synthase 3 [Streptomyces sp. MBT65]MBK3578925.1 beta-ketoacyl-ACP synthase 3 [Streptomyces sp. MBT65]
MNAVAVITGLGASLPPDRISNEQLVREGLDTSDAWIRTRTGIHSRHRVRPGTTTGDLATAAARGALESAGVHDAGLLILATTTPDRRCPATAPELAARLGMTGTPAFDLAAVCSGFVYAAAVASAVLMAGAYDSVLLVAAETYSTIVDPRDRETAVIFGDGAGAAYLTRGDQQDPGALVHFDLGSDGTGSDLITIPAGGSSSPYTDEPPPRQDRYFRMRGREVYARAVRQMADSSRTVLDRAGWTVDSVEAFVAHQANQRILDSVADRLGIPPERCHGNLREVGNTAAASLPLALADTAARGAVAPGARTLLTAFGGGLTWGSIAMTWPEAKPVRHAPAARPTHKETDSCLPSTTTS